MAYPGFPQGQGQGGAPQGYPPGFNPQQGQGLPPRPSGGPPPSGPSGGAPHNDITTQFGSGGMHSYSGEELRAFSNYINNRKELRENPVLRSVLPIDPQNHDLFFKKFEDGVLLCHFINSMKPGMIDTKHITAKPGMTVFHKTQNLNTALNACRELGFQLTNIGSEDFLKGVRTLVLSVIWQAVRHGMLSHVNLQEHPELVMALEENIDAHSFLSKTPEDGLLRWMNYQLRMAGSPLQVRNFSGDVKSGEAYLTIMSQIAPHIVNPQVRGEQNPTNRANMVCDFANKMGLESFLTPEDILQGNKNLNLLFVADMFNKYPGISTDNIDAARQRSLEEAEAKMKAKMAEEEANRRARWAWEEEQRKKQWAEEDAQRKQQFASEDAQRNAQRDQWNAEQQRLEQQKREFEARQAQVAQQTNAERQRLDMERQQWEEEQRRKKYQDDQAAQAKEEEMIRLEEQTRNMHLQTTRQQADMERQRQQAQAQEAERQRQQQMQQQQIQQTNQYQQRPPYPPQGYGAPPPMGYQPPMMQTTTQYRPPMMTVVQPPPPMMMVQPAPIMTTQVMYQPPVPQRRVVTTTTTTTRTAPRSTPTVVYQTSYRKRKKWKH
eukprot:TRINITY_DN89_c0_g1_i1.p1 TRINITY_DN89_c0_g1~~TRINITY_DN89_c0_g1_i1.p1  ORF type:complete len:624 (+),score=140.40 TRINITY_DN89_c0_g1_i1:60-1874(+)